ncbi:MAG TPA: hypothetical protein VNL96_00995, partial [Gemmatimonadaceae bacterium]|nr:hypothetical protein [Gemmatimonadaceae bacterium]
MFSNRVSALSARRLVASSFHRTGVRCGLLAVLLSFWAGSLEAQRRGNPQPRPESMTLERYDPRSMLVVPATPVLRAKYPFVDVHGHQNLTMPDERLAQLVQQMDNIGLRTMVNLSGGWGERLAAQVRNANAKYPGRFVVFANVDWSRVNEPGFAESAARQLEVDVRQGGAAGLKVFKDLGMDIYWADGS